MMILCNDVVYCMWRENILFSLYVLKVDSNSFKTSILRVLLNKYKTTTGTDKFNHVTNIKLQLFELRVLTLQEISAMT